MKTKNIGDPRDAVVAIQKPMLKLIQSALPYLRGQRLRREIIALMVEDAALLKEIENSDRRRGLNDHDETRKPN